MPDITPSPAPETVEAPVVETVVQPDTPTPVVEVEAAAPPPADSWGKTIEDIRSVNPEMADRVAKLHGAASNEAGALARQVKAKTEVDPFGSMIAKRWAGMEEGDPYEGIELATPAAPDFDAMIGDMSDDVLTDKGALKTALKATLGQFWEAAVVAARDVSKDTVTQANRAAYKPIVETVQRQQLEEQGRRAEAEVAKLPGMASDAARDMVYDAMEAAGSRGIDAFRSTYAAMLPEHPEWIAPPAPAAPQPQVIVRTAPPKPAPAPVDPSALSALGFLGVNSVNGGGLPSALPRGLDPAARSAAIARSPEWQAVKNGTAEQKRAVLRQFGSQS